jgi:hypothetical protein
MNGAKAVVFLLLPLLVAVMVPGQVRGQSGTPGTKLRRLVPPDTETMVSSASRWRYREGEGQRQCSPNGMPDLALVMPPEHGTVRFVDADLGIPKGSGCINSVYGKAVLYRPNPGSSARIDLSTTFQMTQWRSSTWGVLQGRGRCSLSCVKRTNVRGNRRRPGV